MKLVTQIFKDYGKKEYFGYSTRDLHPKPGETNYVFLVELQVNSY